MLKITVENMYASDQSDRQMTYYPEWGSIVNDVVENSEVIRKIYYKKQAKPININFEKTWTDELGDEVRRPEKSVDPYLIIDAVTLAEKVYVIVLLAGDKDYMLLMWYLKSRGCKVKLANFREFTARVMLEQADTFHELSGDRHTLNLPAKH